MAELSEGNVVNDTRNHVRRSETFDGLCDYLRSKGMFPFTFLYDIFCRMARGMQAKNERRKIVHIIASHGGSNLGIQKPVMENFFFIPGYSWSNETEIHVTQMMCCGFLSKLGSEYLL